MKALILVFGFALTAIPAVAATITPPEAKAHVGEIVTVEGIVSEVHHAASGKVTFIDMGGRYPNNAFAAVIFADDASKFPIVDSLEGKTVDISGSIRLYKGKPEIILNDPTQLKAK
jgi:DNA/RNA endonuclease YhcR with UshA esterase domain